MTKRDRPTLWLFALCTVQAGTVLVFSNFAGALPLIKDGWQLSNSEAGAIQAASQFGYVLAVLVLSSLTDYAGSKRMIIGGAVWAGLGNLAMAAFANDVASAVVLRALTGMGVAGIYMPGLKLIAQLFPPERRGRAVGLFVGSFTIGAAASVALGGTLAASLGWRSAFALASMGPFVGAGFALIVLPSTGRAERPQRSAESRSISELVHNRPALFAIVIYTAHAWELLGLRSWLPAFLTVALIRTGASLTIATRGGATMAGLATLVSAVSTAAAASLSDKFGRTRTIMVITSVSLISMLGLGLTLDLSWTLIALAGLVTAIFANSDSAVISTTLTETVPADYLGRVLALYSFLGFSAGSVAPLVFGAVLDIAGPASGATVTQWGLAFSTLALGSLVVLTMTALLHRQIGRSKLTTAQAQ